MEYACALISRLPSVSSWRPYYARGRRRGQPGACGGPAGGGAHRGGGIPGPPPAARARAVAGAPVSDELVAARAAPGRARHARLFSPEATTAVLVDIYREAIAQLRLAVEREPADAYLRLELAGLAYRLGRADEAVEQAREARRLSPDDPDVLAAVADVLLGLAGEREHHRLVEPEGEHHHRPARPAVL